jgi:hypothetical protein
MARSVCWVFCRRDSDRAAARRRSSACSGASGPTGSRALRRYSLERRAHVRFYALASRWLTPLFQSSYRFVGPLRDGVFPWLTRIPLLERAMLATLAGVRRGIVRKSLPLEPLRALLPDDGSPVMLVD